MPKDKANEIVEKFGKCFVHRTWNIDMWDGLSDFAKRKIKEASLICVKETISAIDNPCSSESCDCTDPNFWTQVKQELETL